MRYVLVPSAADNLAVADHHGSNRDLARFQGASCTTKRFFHPEFVSPWDSGSPRVLVGHPLNCNFRSRRSDCSRSSSIESGWPF